LPESKKDAERRVRVRVGDASPRKEETRITPWRAEDYLGQMDRMFEDFESRFERTLDRFPGLGFPGFFGPGRRWLELPETRHPSADLVDSGREYRVVAEVPGIPKEKLDVTVTDREIKIEGEAKTDLHEEKEGFVRRERGYSRISRRLTFPEPVVAERAEASLNNGVLEVKVPKKAPTTFTRRKIEVK
jgi:HSP20 family molecular chaperone IbpA